MFYYVEITNIAKIIITLAVRTIISFMNRLKVIAMIPARYASSRFPGKLLAPLGGVPVIVRTCKAAAGMDFFSDVYVVTDDSRIRDAAADTGVKCIMSRSSHETGSDRIAEAAAGIDCDIIVNIQGDEPFIQARTIAGVLEPFYLPGSGDIDLCTLKERMTDKDEIASPDNVKVITDINGFAIYFSRYPIPYPRDNFSDTVYYRHIGIYAFRKDTLMMFPKWKMLQNEASEKIECLRFLEHGKRIKVVETEGMQVSIDTPEDLARAEAILRERK